MKQSDALTIQLRDEHQMTYCKIKRGCEKSERTGNKTIVFD